MQDTQWATVRAEELDEGRLLHLVLDAGKGNVLDRKSLREMREALALLGTEPALRAIVIGHAGPHFSYGASVQEHAPERVREMLGELHALARDLLALDVPLVACVRGLCLGGGLELAALADRLFAAPDARFGQPESALGVFAPIGSALLPRRIGPANALDLLLTGRTIGAEEAAGLGLVSSVVPDPERAAFAWVRDHLVDKSACALRHVTRAARRAWARGFLSDLAELESAYLDELMLTHDAREGLAAFLEKREPVWEDR